MSNILHIMWHMNIGGAERAIYQLVNEQNRRGVHSDLLVINELGYYGEKCKAVVKNVYFLNSNNRPSREKVEVYKSIICGYKKVHFHSAEFKYIKYASKIQNIQLYYTHRAGIHKFTFKQKIRHKITGYYLRKYFQGYSANTKLGAKSGSRIYKIPESKFQITYNGLDFDLLKEDTDKSRIVKLLKLKDEIVIGTNANIRSWKRIDKLLHLATRIKGKIVFLIIGDGPDKKRLLNLAANLGVNERVKFISRVENIMNYLQIIDIFVLPSGNAESFGNSAVESIAVGIPTIVFSDGGGLPEHIINGKTGFIVKNDDELLKTILTLINDRNLRKDIGSAGKEYIRNKYSLDNMIKSYNKLYEQ